MFGWTLKTGGVALVVWCVLMTSAGYEALADPVVEVNADLEVTGDVKVGTTTVDPQHIAHFKGRVLAENGETSSGTARNEGFSLWTDEAFGIERHYSNSSWQTAVFGRETDSAALTFGASNEDEDEQGSFYHYMTIRNNGEVGIGTENPVEILDIQGVMAIKSMGFTDPDSSIGYGKLYAKGWNGDMYVMDKDGNVTQLTSHKDPRDFAPDLQGSSFGDPEVVLPFSFHHTNAYIGKGAVVDLAAVVRDLEAMTFKGSNPQSR